jgi:branched-chain amino acid transport system substrate-binding protein
VTEAIYEAYVPGENDYAPEIAKLQGANIAVAFIGGYHTEIGLMARAARDRGYQVQLVTGSSLASEEFGLIAGPAAEGTLFTFLADPRRNAEAAPVVERFRASGFEPEGYTLYAYGAVQVWAQAADKAGSLELSAMIASLRENQFDTVLGQIDFDEKGDVTTQTPIWHVWRSGTYVPLQSKTANHGGSPSAPQAASPLH